RRCQQPYHYLICRCSENNNRPPSGRPSNQTSGDPANSTRSSLSSTSNNQNGNSTSNSNNQSSQSHRSNNNSSTSSDSVTSIITHVALQPKLSSAKELKPIPITPTDRVYLPTLVAQAEDLGGSGSVSARLFMDTGSMLTFVT